MTAHRIGSAVTLLAACSILLAGCGGSSSSLQSKTPPPASAQARGEVFGGQQPITGMTLQLYDAGAAGYGSAATGLLTAPLPQTDANGSFNFANPACASDPNNKDQLYLVGAGGDPMAAGQGQNKSNSSLALMVVLGSCGNLNNIAHIHMNELTTVAAVWALAPFMSGNTLAFQNIGASSTNAAGLQMAFAAAAQVTNIANGTIPGTLPTGATLQNAEVNTIADVLEFCINSIDGAGSTPSSACASLFAAAPSGSGNPTDTITAAMNIAQNPARNVTTLDQGISNTSTFQPIVAAPTAYTIAIQYTGGGLDHPAAIAADQAGQIWVANSGSSNTVSLFDNLGNSRLATTGTQLAGTPGGVAIDTSGNAWITASNNEVYELDTAGAATGSPLTANGLNLPTGIAIDPANNIWVVNSGGGANSVSAFTSAGAPLANSPFTGAGISAPAGIAVNGNANAHCADCH
jgi:hypothetical protein